MSCMSGLNINECSLSQSVRQSTVRLLPTSSFFSHIQQPSTATARHPRVPRLLTTRNTNTRSLSFVSSNNEEWELCSAYEGQAFFLHPLMLNDFFLTPSPTSRVNAHVSPSVCLRSMHTPYLSSLLWSRRR